MEIQELHLKHYGKFEDHRIRLRPGINIIYGGNETGKTTIHSFIRSMFFGLNRAKGRAARMDEYQIRQPWDRPGAFMGSMRILEQGEVYRIDRCFDRSTKPLQITCETGAWEASDPEGVLAALTGGISETAFVNTVFIPQAHCETDEALAQELQRYMVNSDNTGDGSVDVARALQSLRKKKKQFEQKQKKEDELLEGQIEKKQAKAEMIRGELERLKAQAEFYRSGGSYEAAGRNVDRHGSARMQGTVDGYGSARMQGTVDGYGTARMQGTVDGYGSAQMQGTVDGYGSARMQGTVDGYGMARMQENAWNGEPEEEWLDDEDDWNDPHAGKIRKLLQIILLAAGILAVIGAVMLEPINVKLFLGIFAAVFFIMIPVVQVLLGRPRKKAETPQTQAAAVPQYLLDEIQNHEEAYQTLRKELEELYQKNVKIDGADTEVAALTLAIDRLCELSSDIYERSGGKLGETASRILSEITDGRYQRIVLDDTATVRIHTPERVLGLQQVSGGTMQQIYFALRMAAGELLSNGAVLPVILDETFAMYDDERLEAALRWLKRSKRQVILFTCQKREREIMRRIE